MWEHFGLLGNVTLTSGGPKHYSVPKCLYVELVSPSHSGSISQTIQSEKMINNNPIQKRSVLNLLQCKTKDQTPDVSRHRFFIF